MLDRDEAGAKQVATDVGGDHLVADLSDGESIDALGLGTEMRADILVNNAGVQHVAAVEDFDPERFALHPAADARGAVPAGPRPAARHVRRAAGAGWCTSRRCTGTARSPYKAAYVAPSTASRVSPR